MAVSPKQWVVVGVVVVLLGAFLVLTIGKPAGPVGPITPTSTSAVTASGQPMLPTKQITIGNVPLTVEVASTPKEQETGLSGRAGLAEGAGMLFVFPQPSMGAFWMKDMLFSLDIIFADAGGNIVTITPNLSPATYPNVYPPTSPATYALEVPAGFAAAHGIAVGQKIVVQ
jgi:uncharacterized membrane protein (UPF0127 family)